MPTLGIDTTGEVLNTVKTSLASSWPNSVAEFKSRNAESSLLASVV
jgi:hypothetical protein